MAHKVEELPVYQAAQKLWRVVHAILQRAALCRDRRLHDQICDANESITSNISEGFDQPSDAALSSYLYHSKGSLAEVQTRLGTARRKNYLTQEELDHCLNLAEAVGRQLGGFIKYLARSDFKDRGRFKARGGDKGLRDQGSRDQGSRDRGSKD